MLIEIEALAGIGEADNLAAVIGNIAGHRRIEEPGAGAAEIGEHFSPAGLGPAEGAVAIVGALCKAGHDTAIAGQSLDHSGKRECLEPVVLRPTYVLRVIAPDSRATVR